MKTCPYCNSQVNDNARFCIHCMSSLIEKQVIPNIVIIKRWPQILAAVLVLLLFVSLPYSFDFFTKEKLSENPQIDIPADNSELYSPESETEDKPADEIITSNEDLNEKSEDTLENIPNNSDQAKPPQADENEETISSPSTPPKTEESTNTETSKPTVIVPDVLDDEEYISNAKTYGVLSYSVSGSEVIIESCSKNATGHITIPTLIEGKTVKTIASQAFKDCNNITSIIIEDGLKIISTYAFQGCSALKSITIPDSVIEIGAAAFENCSALESIKLPSVPTLNNHIFYNCTCLKTVYIGEYTTAINYNCFYNCISLREIHIPSYLRTVNSSAFHGCSALEIYYGGTETLRNKITIESGNNALSSGVWHYKSY